MRLPLLVLTSALFAGNAFSATPQILTNHLGYETTGSKRAVILGHSGDTVSKCALKTQSDDKEVFAIDSEGDRSGKEVARLVFLDDRFRFCHH